MFIRLVQNVRPLLVVLCLVLAPASGRAAVILQYHHVSADTPAATSVTPRQFAAHLQALADEGFEVVPLDQLFARVRDGVAAERKLAAITFDDGYDNVARHALPMLEQRGWKAAIFVTTGQVGQAGMLSADALREIHDRGHLLLNHSQTHAHLVRRQAGESEHEWLARIEEEITGAQARLGDILGEAPAKVFAYPYGEQDAAIQHLLRRLGYIGVGQQSGALDRDVNWQLVPRIPVNRQYADWASLRDKVLALPLPASVVEPSDGVTGQARPTLTFSLPRAWQDRALNCFAAGSAITPRRDVDGARLRITLEGDIPVGRSRYTCTAPAADGRFYWFSWMWMRRGAGGWYEEY